MKNIFQKMKKDDIWNLNAGNLSAEKNVEKIVGKNEDSRKKRLVDGIKPFFSYLFLACLLNYFLEVFSRHSFYKAVAFVGKSPLVFLYNAFIIFLTLSLVLFARKKLFATIFVCIVWIVSAFANYIVLFFRTTPFSAIDIMMIRNVMTMLDKYLTKWQIVLSVVGIFLAILLLVYLYLRLPVTEKKRHPFRASAYVCMCLILMWTFTKVAVQTHTISDNFGNLAYAYNDYGFAYCFTNSVIDVGINKPKDYSKQAVHAIVDGLNYDKTGVVFERPEEVSEAQTEEPVTYYKNEPATKEFPNVIIIQLESIFDTKYMKDFYPSEDPMPTLTNLKKRYSTGLFTVPAVGAGTANTEFEVQTGMSAQFFGAGEYPFKTVMRSMSCGTMAYDLKRQGYATAGFHNNDATFYERYIDYSNLGFDCFSGMEHMYNLEYTPRGWAKDSQLDDMILERVRQTEGRDYITTITVQCHGRYPNEITKTKTGLTCYFEGQYAENIEKQAAWQYYINMCRETDNMLSDLINGLKEFNEPTAVFLYGDHLPSLSLNDTDLDGISLYQTEWMMWDNIGLKPEKKELTAYQASTYLFNRLGLPGGLMQQFHNKFMLSLDHEDYLHKLEMLEYDILYGENYAYDGENPFPQTDMKMGIREIQVTELESRNEYVWIHGVNFNSFSVVKIDGKEVETRYLNQNLIAVLSEDFEKGRELSVAQIGDDNIELSETEIMLINEAESEEEGLEIQSE